MSKTQADRFTFSSYSNSVGAVLHQPAKVFMSDGPCAALPVTGGLIAHEKENIEFKLASLGILRIGRASSSVLGEHRGGEHFSLATATVEKLNILDVITADAVVSRVTSVYRTTNGKRGVKFYLAGSHFDNLKIDGKLIDCKGEPDFQSSEGFFIDPTEARRPSLFPKACEFSIPEFGVIYLGEVDIYSSKIILTMLRAELGCPIIATVTTGNTSTNGRDGG